MNKLRIRNKLLNRGCKKGNSVVGFYKYLSVQMAEVQQIFPSHQEHTFQRFKCKRTVLRLEHLICQFSLFDKRQYYNIGKSLGN